jgi:hypothetical protein
MVEFDNARQPDHTECLCSIQPMSRSGKNKLQGRAPVSRAINARFLIN